MSTEILFITPLTLPWLDLVSKLIEKSLLDLKTRKFGCILSDFSNYASFLKLYEIIST